MIRYINRLEEHQRGRIIVAGIELTSDIKNIEAICREVGMVFQIRHQSLLSARRRA
jgi:general L-amino acid transport system ATP-binding protein